MTARASRGLLLREDRLEVAPLSDEDDEGQDSDDDRECVVRLFDHHVEEKNVHHDRSEQSEREIDVTSGEQQHS